MAMWSTSQHNGPAWPIVVYQVIDTRETSIVCYSSDFSRIANSDRSSRPVESRKNVM